MLIASLQKCGSILCVAVLHLENDGGAGIYGGIGIAHRCPAFHLLHIQSPITAYVIFGFSDVASKTVTQLFFQRVHNLLCSHGHLCLALIVIGLSAAGGQRQHHRECQEKSQNAFHFYLLLLKFRICFMSGGTASPETPLPCPSIHPYEGAEQNVGKRTKKFRGVFTLRNFSSSIAFHQRIGNLGDS